VLDACLGAELSPHRHRFLETRCDVLRDVGQLVGVLVGPGVLVLLADALAGWVVMVRTEVQPVDRPVPRWIRANERVPARVLNRAVTHSG
jgi:hypothetical protein